MTDYPCLHIADAASVYPSPYRELYLHWRALAMQEREANAALRRLAERKITLDDLIRSGLTPTLCDGAACTKDKP